MNAAADRQFTSLARQFLDARAERHPELATGLGDHRFDARLSDRSAPAIASERRALDSWIARLEALDARALTPEHQVDTAMLERLASVAGRLAEIPAALAATREQFGRMPRVHLETAIGQFGGTISLVRDQIDAALRDVPGRGREIEAVRPAALEALAGHRDWLAQRLDQAAATGDFADPRLGPDLFARKLSLTLSAADDADAILARAHDDLDRVTGEITEPASRIAFVRENDLLTLHDDPLEVIEMPELDRGVAIAYCDSPGPLETAAVPTFIAVSPTPADWPPARVASFYREYNRHMTHDLMIHEAMPGHYAQLGHSRRFSGSATTVRANFRSGSFVEGWAVYAERVMAEKGYPGEGDPRAVRMRQLKMELRMISNAIIDARVYGHGMTETEAMALMTGRGYQEEGEAAGKWRRALLTSAQLSTCYVGSTEVRDLAAELRAASPGSTDRAIHDRMLAHGSPPVRLLRTLITL